MIEKNSSTLRKTAQLNHNMIQTPSSTGHGCSGWKWKKFKCNKCSTEVPYNKCVDHFIRKHFVLWKQFLGSIQDFITKNYEEVIMENE